MTKIDEQKALETIIDHFHGNCSVERAQGIVDELLDMELAVIKRHLTGKKIVLLEGWGSLYDSYKTQSRGG